MDREPLPAAATTRRWWRSYHTPPASRLGCRILTAQRKPGAGKTEVVDFYLGIVSLILTFRLERKKDWIRLLPSVSFFAPCRSLPVIPERGPRRTSVSRPICPRNRELRRAGVLPARPRLFSTLSGTNWPRMFCSSMHVILKLFFLLGTTKSRPSRHVSASMM